MRVKAFPSLEQVHRVLAVMPHATDIEQRDRALVAFTLLTGARDGALISLKLKHIDVEQQRVDQDAREVRTKGAKTFSTCFYPVGGEAARIVAEWIAYLRKDLLWSEADPMFPATRMTTGADGGFVAAGLDRKPWSTAEAVRRIFKSAFALAGLPYFKPHTFRDTLVQLGERVCKTPEEFKAWSQNLGHEHVLTTFTSYGAVAYHRQAELIRGLSRQHSDAQASPEDVLSRIAALVASRDANGDASSL